MDKATFVKKLAKYSQVRGKDFQGKSCTEWSLEESRKYRQALEESRRNANAQDKEDAAMMAQLGGLQGDFFSILSQELRAHGYTDQEAAAASQQFKTVVMNKVVGEYNLEELESILHGK